jgi:hypothetical protein
MEVIRSSEKKWTCNLKYASSETTGSYTNHTGNGAENKRETFHFVLVLASRTDVGTVQPSHEELKYGPIDGRSLSAVL